VGDKRARSGRGVWAPAEQQEHIHLLEIKAILNALNLFKDKLANKCIRLWCDNQVYVETISRKWSKVAEIRRLLERLEMQLQEIDSTLVI
jgi:ribonuclease HI